MYYAGIDYHKRYSVVSIQDGQGRTVQEQRVDHAYPELFGRLFRECPEPVEVVYESTINWSWLYEILQPAVNVASITLANPYKVRLIAEAQIKTDKISARALATLLRLHVVPAFHIPDRKTRQRKEVLRQRSYWVKQRTGVRCRVHKILTNQHHLSMPQVTDLFGRKGRAALDKAILPEPDDSLLRQNLTILDALDKEIGSGEQLIRKNGQADRAAEVLLSMPGIGLILANVIATETDGITRFRDSPPLHQLQWIVPDGPQFRRQDLHRPHGDAVQSLAQVGVRRGRLGGGGLLGLLRRLVSLPSRPWQAGEHGDYHRGPAHVSYCVPSC